MNTGANNVDAARARRAQGWRTVWSSLIATAVSVYGWGRQRDIEFHNNADDLVPGRDAEYSRERSLD